MPNSRAVPLFLPGEYYTLRILRFTSVGAYLGSDPTQSEPSVLLPNKYLKPGMKESDEVEVFVYLDSEDRPVATTQTPLIHLGRIASLEVKEVNRIGAFLDWGLEKDLLVPHAEMVFKLEVGERYLFGLFRDEKTGRLVGTPMLGKLLTQENTGLKHGEMVDLVIYNETELGFQVVVNGKHGGLIYHSELDRPIGIGEHAKGYVKQIRDDGKIDVSLRPIGVAGIEPNAQKVMAALHAKRGVLELSDKSDPAKIEQQLKMSKKAFKKAIGSLYRKKLITIEAHRIRSMIQNHVPEGPKHLRNGKN